jgi:lysophospholipase L1-like esterase
MKLKVLSLGLVLLCNLIPYQNAQAMGGGKPSYLMASLGDSITAATLADTTTYSPWTGIQLLPPDPNAPADPLHLPGAKNLENKSSYSWASGQAIQSQYMKLQDYVKRTEDKGVYELNVAVPGSVSSDMPGQADQIVNAAKSGGFLGVKYVTLFIGANDATSSESPNGTPDSKMHDSLITTFRKLASIQQPDKIRVLVSSIPKIPDLGRPEINNHTDAEFTTCKGIRKDFFTYADNHLTLWDTQTQYDTAMAVVHDKNALLQSIASEAGSLFPNLDVVFSSAVFNYDIEANDLAIDCFHPNAYGQQKISDRVWAEQPWFN